MLHIHVIQVRIYDKSVKGTSRSRRTSLLEWREKQRMPQNEYATPA